MSGFSGCVSLNAPSTSMIRLHITSILVTRAGRLERFLRFFHGRGHAAEFEGSVKSKRRPLPFHQVRWATGLSVSKNTMFPLKKHRRVSERKLFGLPIPTDS